MKQAMHVGNEMAYDLICEHMDTILRVVNGPVAKVDVIAQLGCATTFDRLVRLGLLQCDGQWVRSTASVFHKTRQEGMMNFLQNYVLPTVIANVDESGHQDPPTLQTRYLHLDDATVRGLRSAAVQDLLTKLSDISDLPAAANATQMRVCLFGTTSPSPELLPIGDQALIHLQRAAAQRATHAERDKALLLEYLFLADSRGFQSTLRAVDDFLATLQRAVCSPSEATYHLTVVSYWRGSDAIKELRPHRASTELPC